MSHHKFTAESASPLQVPTMYPPELAQLLLLKQQINNYEHSSPNNIRQVQEKQLAALFRHAHQYSQFWQNRLNSIDYQLIKDDPFKVLSALPVLSRNNLQQHFDSLKARWKSLEEKQIITAKSSGSTGEPVRVEKEVNRYMCYYTATSLLEHEWQQRNPRKTIAILGIGMTPAKRDSWGKVYEMLGMFGRSEIRAAESGTLDDHLDWLAALKPAYLKCSPVLAMELARRAIEQKRTITFDQVISHWERIAPAHQYWVKCAFAAPIINRYSCEELGWLAISCPQQHLHVCSPTVLLEIVDNNNQPCPPGQTGRVLVTALQSFAMPLIRYELGDLAEWGEPCSCGRPMPVLKKIWGRERHLIKRPDGKQIPMPFLGDEIGQLKSIRAFRFRQYAKKDIVLELEVTQKLTTSDIQQLTRIVNKNGLDCFPFHIAEVNRIDWPKQRKRDEFIRIDSPWQGNL
ncbi:hypothetical protein GCM10011403_01190 [Pseudohongiella nitratireducens]|uniref:Coenzyme F390 synthetase n=1 Tax=Pseudohongiella nitratireducens TaxID=1768907 RepID=A0A917LP15_9GAMM|nr:phenylacetate--CoA ligase family protein [Pseudohongiella nitratireducens]GGG47904.1 hypothetical protein GCM10011403_01190 [Pseudohongiella nitratireducens]